MVREAGLILLIVLASGCQAARTAVEPQSLVISEPAETAGVRPASVSRVVAPVRPELAGPVSLDVVVAEVLRQHGGVQAAQQRMVERFQDHARTRPLAIGGAVLLLLQVRACAEAPAFASEEAKARQRAKVSPQVRRASSSASSTTRASRSALRHGS